VVWRVEILDKRVERELDALAIDIRQRFLRIVELVEIHGVAAMREPHIKHLEGKLWKMRMKGKDGIARAIYVTAERERVVVLHAFTKKTQKTPARALDVARTRAKGSGLMGIPISKLKKRWMKEPGFKGGYDALEAEFTLASILIEARTRAKLSQQEVAKKMGTSQSTIARLESGAARPSLSTLERFAKATGMRVRLSLEPVVVRKKKARSTVSGAQRPL
jgi:phage-related protein/DNA-binding phage protein